MQLGQELFSGIPELVVERGVKYYRQGRVEDLAVRGRTVLADVRGSEVYFVQLDVDFPHLNSECDCPYDDLCKHIVAVFCQLYDEQLNRNPRLFWQQLRAAAQVAQRVRPTPTPSTRAAADRQAQARAPKVPVGPSPDGTMAEWLAYLDDASPWATQRLSTLTPYDVDRAVNDTLRVAAAWPKAAQMAYRLLAHVFVIRQVVRRLRDGTVPTYAQYSYTRVAGTSLDALEQLLVGVRHGEFPKPSAVQLAFLQSFLRELVVDGPDASQVRLNAYLLSWDIWLRHELPLADEIAYWSAVVAEDARAATSAAVGDVDPALYVLAHLHVLTGDDAAALRLLGDVQPALADYCFYTVQVLQAEDLWSRMLTWLQYMEPVARELRYPHFLSLCDRYIVLASEEAAALPDCERFLLKHLPDSETPYCRFLLASAQHRAWVEYQMVTGRLPSDVDNGALKQVGQAAPEVLLPFYHQAVERFVQMKNRDAYKLAVRHLVKLGTYYKKLKRQDAWATFLARFTARHARLRALQEEMRKRGLVS